MAGLARRFVPPFMRLLCCISKRGNHMERLTLHSLQESLLPDSRA